MALTKTTNRAFRAKKWRWGHDQNIFPGTMRPIGAPISLRTGAPHFQIRSGATVYFIYLFT